MPRCTECDRLVPVGEPCGWCVTAPDPEPMLALLDPEPDEVRRQELIDGLRAITRRKDKP